MIGVLRGELARSARRPSLWLLSMLAAALVAVIAAHNISGVRLADLRLEAARGEHVVAGCIVYADGTNSGFCPGADAAPASAAEPGEIVATTVRGDPQDFIDAHIADTARDAVRIREALAPARRGDLALAALGSMPGIALAIVLGALVVGGDYAWGTRRALLLAGRSRVALVVARLVLVWMVVLVWLLLGLGASAATFALSRVGGLSPGVAWAVSPTVALAAWSCLGAFATAAGLAAAATRSALGGAAITTGLVAALRFVPYLAGAPAGRWSPLVVLAGNLSPSGTFASTASSIALTATLGLPSRVDERVAGIAQLGCQLGVCAVVAASAVTFMARQEVT